ncbi:MAG TPA: NAD-dependent epimerase/dehydratase family protein [Candidatus Eisenbacteria bacterium]|nr:NAD-dependent epimerase/dehydratase family protein [Candidatus Eisenbacteria bacterium]
MSGPLAVVTGASGFVGSHVVDELLRRGARVRCLLRSSSSRRWLEGKPVELVFVSLDDAPALEAAVAGATWIVHAAGLTSARSAAEFHAVNVGGTERMLRAALAAGPELRRFLYVSSLAAAGPSRDGMPVTEAHPPRPVSAYGESKLRGEELVHQLRDRLPVCSVRPPAVYGPRDEATLKVFRALRWHVRPELRAHGRFSMIYVEDLARAIALVLEDERALGEIFFASEPDVCDYERLGVEAQAAMGSWAVPLRLPGWLLTAGAMAGEAWGAITRTPPFLSRAKLQEIGAGDWICSSAKIRSRLGWAPSVPMEEGLKRSVAWYREAGWV